ncbi:MULTISPECIES: ImmA/IrrE family metallo-endopeptidase [unclassified Amycolatopsis]|uniref:ImmA/IrrE family metallo-endopeptidase n=1 Tax=unclassified Amycolatopsis TaxID=2618356 RepID=UPI002876A961|nr:MULTISPECIES: ImmA/IrrE family metallo-endopeptidase [unclassified Amycolatopsis]MDS0133210.1 ImmA/IrrE family metallo-endopeptidase [Amycolatopsis sp. 505]MDS0146440.1 ImmA/IrrE family metallo-endopeptidase [Amycolatopsis sp. CM201R]
MRRGFKSEAERLADRTREELGLAPTDHLPIRDLATFLGVPVYAADELVDPAELDELDQLQPGAFSAATFHLPDGGIVVVNNPKNSAARTNSDIAHELAHLLLNHDVRDIQQLAGETFFTCNPEQETEANWLAGCLLLPRALLLREAYADSSAETIAEKYEVSVQMARYRLNTSGVMLQVRRARSSRPSQGRTGRQAR